MPISSRYLAAASFASATTTLPVTGSVPSGRRNKRMCGSGLRRVVVGEAAGRGRQRAGSRVGQSGRPCVAARLSSAAVAHAPVNSVVHPATALLHAHLAPLLLVEQAVARDLLGELLGEDHVPAWRQHSE